MLKQLLEKHFTEFKPVVHCRIWKNRKKNQNQKNNYVYINFHYRIDGEFQLNL